MKTPRYFPTVLAWISALFHLKESDCSSFFPTNLNCVLASFSVCYFSSTLKFYLAPLDNCIHYSLQKSLFRLQIRLFHHLWQALEAHWCAKEKELVLERIPGIHHVYRIPGVHHVYTLNAYLEDPTASLTIPYALWENLNLLQKFLKKVCLLLVVRW